MRNSSATQTGGRNICGSLQDGSKADVEGLKGQKTEDEHPHGKEDGAGAPQVVVHHPSYVGTAVADGAAARHGLGDEGDGKHVDYAQYNQDRYTGQRPDAGNGDGQSQDGDADGLG